MRGRNMRIIRAFLAAALLSLPVVLYSDRAALAADPPITNGTAAAADPPNTTDVGHGAAGQAQAFATVGDDETT